MSNRGPENGQSLYRYQEDEPYSMFYFKIIQKFWCLNFFVYPHVYVVCLDFFYPCEKTKMAVWICRVPLRTFQRKYEGCSGNFYKVLEIAGVWELP